jgi:hypothetical protein
MRSWLFRSCVKLQPRELYFPAEVMAPWKRDWQPTDTDCASIRAERGTREARAVPCRSIAWPERPLYLREREEVQEVPRGVAEGGSA